MFLLRKSPWVGSLNSQPRFKILPPVSAAFVYNLTLIACPSLRSARIRDRRLTGKNSVHAAVKKLSSMLSEEFPVWQLLGHLCSVTKPKKCIDPPGCTWIESYFGLLLWPFKDGGYMLFNGPSKTRCDFHVCKWGLAVKGCYTSPRCPHFPAGDLLSSIWAWWRMNISRNFRKGESQATPQPMKPESAF